MSLFKEYCDQIQSCVTVFVNIANHVYKIQNISQNMAKNEVLSTAFVIYKVAEMTKDDDIVVMPKTTISVSGNGRDRICKHLRHFEKDALFRCST